MDDLPTTRHLGPLERMDNRSPRSAPLATAHLSMYPIQAFHTFEFGSHTSFLVREKTEPSGRYANMVKHGIHCFLHFSLGFFR